MSELEWRIQSSPCWEVCRVLELSPSLICGRAGLLWEQARNRRGRMAALIGMGPGVGVGWAETGSSAEL